MHFLEVAQRNLVHWRGGRWCSFHFNRQLEVIEKK